MEGLHLPKRHYLPAVACYLAIPAVMIACTSFQTGIPVAGIGAELTASSGTHAFGEALETLCVVPLIYLLWPVVFYLAGQMSGPQSIAPHPISSPSPN